MSHYEATLARIQEIESRLLSYRDQESLTPTTSRLSKGSASTGNQKSGSLPLPTQGKVPFNVALGQATGEIAIKSTGAGHGGPAFAPYIEGLITRYSAQNGLSPDLVRAVIRQESDGNTRDVSNKDARGLMQLMPDEIEQFGVQDPFDPEQNIQAGTRILGGLLKQYNGNVSLALAAYNAGPGAVAKHNGIPPFKETRQYVHNILHLIGQDGNE